MKRVLVMWSVMLLGLSGAPRAQTPSAAILGRDDLAFALHLVRSGHPDLADGVCRALLHFGNCETAVLSHAARERALGDVDREAIRSAVASSPRHAGRRGTSLRPMGLMLYAAGRKLLGVPDELSAFLDWDGDPARAAGLWSDAATLLQAAHELGDEQDVLLTLARLYRLFGNPTEAALRYEELFQHTQFVDPITGRIDRQVLAARPQLLEAYLEWGVVQRKLAAAEEGDAKRFTPSLKVFDNACQTLDAKQPAWWLSKREQILTFLDLGDQRAAQTAFKNVERTTDPELMKQYGFDALRERLR